MAIALRGTPTTGSATNGGNITLNMPAGVATGDVVVVGFALNTGTAGGTSSTGWTQIGANVTNTVRIQIFRKVMGASPDASIVLTGSGVATDSTSALAIAFSGVDNGAPEGGVALTSATATSTNPDPPAITPALNGSVAIIYAGGSAVDVTGTAAPAGYSDFAQTSSTDTASTSSYLAWKGSLTGGTSENPGVFSGVTSTAWAAYTIVLAPLPILSDITVEPNIPPAYFAKAALSVAVLATTLFAWTPPVPAPPPKSGVSTQAHRYEPARRSVDMLGGVVWPAQVPASAAAVTYQEGWRSTFSTPPKAAARSQELLGNQAIWSPRVPDKEFQDGWRSAFSEPAINLKSKPRLEGQIAFDPQVSNVQYQDGWRQAFSEPAIYLKAKPRIEGQISLGPRIADVQYQDGWQSRFTDPPQFLWPRRSVDLLGNVTGMPARVPEKEFQDGWRSKFQEPSKLAARSVALLGDGAIWSARVPSEAVTYGFSNTIHRYEPAKRSVAMLGEVIWPAQVATVVATVYQDGWRCSFEVPPKAAARSVALGQTIWAARVPDVQYQDGWRNAFSEPSAFLKAKPRLEGQVSLGPRVPDREYQDGWRSKFQEPVPRAPRSTSLLGSVTSLPPRVPDKEYQDGWRSAFATPIQPNRAAGLLGSTAWAPQVVAQAVATPTQFGFYSRFTDPPKLAKRSVDLLGRFAQGPRRPEVEYVNGWMNPWEDPPAYNVDVQQVITDEYGDPIYTEDGELILLEDDEVAYRIPRRSVDLLRGWNYEALNYATPAATVTTTMWHNRWPEPPKAPARSLALRHGFAWDPQVIAVAVQYGFSDEIHRYEPVRRSVDLLTGWNYQALSFATQTAVTTEMWHQRWPDSARAAQRSVALNGQVIWSARVPDREYQDGWRSKFQEPPAHFIARRSISLLTGFDWLPRVADRQFQDGWRVQTQDPTHLFKVKPRLPGITSWVPGHVVQTPTQFGFWTQWRPVPWRAPRSIALSGSIAFAIKEPIAPPAPIKIGVSVSFTFTKSPDANAGAKGGSTLTPRTNRGASMTKGAKPAETLSTRTDRGPSLTTGVKKPDA